MFVKGHLEEMHWKINVFKKKSWHLTMTVKLKCCSNSQIQLSRIRHLVIVRLHHRGWQTRTEVLESSYYFNSWQLEIKWKGKKRDRYWSWTGISDHSVSVTNIISFENSNPLRTRFKKLLDVSSKFAAAWLNKSPASGTAATPLQISLSSSTLKWSDGN